MSSRSTHRSILHRALRGRRQVPLAPAPSDARGGSKMSSAGADWQTNPYTQIRWMRDRSSRANVHRRIDRGEIPPTCACCGCETDIAPTPHSPRCPA